MRRGTYLWSDTRRWEFPGFAWQYRIQSNAANCWCVTLIDSRNGNLSTQGILRSTRAAMLEVLSKHTTIDDANQLRWFLIPPDICWPNLMDCIHARFHLTEAGMLPIESRRPNLNKQRDQCWPYYCRWHHDGVKAPHVIYWNSQLRDENMWPSWPMFQNLERKRTCDRMTVLVVMMAPTKWRQQSTAWK